MSATTGVSRIHRGVMNGRVLISSTTTSYGLVVGSFQKRRASR